MCTLRVACMVLQPTDSCCRVSLFYLIIMIITNNNKRQRQQRRHQRWQRQEGSLLWIALEGRENHPESVEALLASLATVSSTRAALTLDKPHINGETALHLLIRDNAVGWCERLLKAGCSTEVKGPYGYSAVHYAVQYVPPHATPPD